MKPYISSLPGLWRERKERGGEKGGRREGVGREEEDRWEGEKEKKKREERGR